MLAEASTRPMRIVGAGDLDPMSPLRVLVAPDSFKGSLTSVQVARALADGWSRGRPDDTVALAPLADGGEGTLDAISAAGGWITLAGRGTRSADAAAGWPVPAPGTSGPWWSWPRPPGCRGSRRRAGWGRGIDLRHRPDPGRGHRARLPRDRAGARRQRHDRWRSRASWSRSAPGCSMRRGNDLPMGGGALGISPGSTSMGCRRCWARST